MVNNIGNKSYLSILKRNRNQLCRKNNKKTETIKQNFVFITKGCCKLLLLAVVGRCLSSVAFR